MSVIFDSGRRRVPVENRLLGLDTRTFRHGFAVLTVFLLFTVVIPRINAAIEWDDPVLAGQQLALTDTIAFTPTTDWNVETGYRVGQGGSAVKSGHATVTSDGVTFDVVPGDFDGAPAQLLDQIQKVTSSTGDPTFRVDDEPATVTTRSGNVGVIQTYSSVRGDGLVAALVIDGTGLEVTAYGPPAQLRAAATDIDDTIASIGTVDSDGSSR